ncbi:MAG: thiopurine S-methyltransferase [Pseudomonadota bacterium]
MSSTKKVVDADFWHRKWEANELGFHQEKVNSRLVKYWPQLGVEAADAVFVPLCGKSLDIAWLAQRHAVVGSELSDIAVRDYFTEQGQAPVVSSEARFTRYSAGNAQLLCGDFFDLTSDDLAGAMAVFDRAALIALPPDLRIRYAKRLGELLAPGGKILLITMIYDQSKMQGPPFSIPEEEVEDLFSDTFAIDKIAESSGPDIVGNLRQRGLDTLTEQVFLMEKH